MPRLQIDGVDIAEISDARAQMLLGAAKRGLGKEPNPAEFQRVVHYNLPSPPPPQEDITLTLVFPV